MKISIPKLPFAGTLVALYIVYTGFVPVSIAHSIILLSLSAFAAFELYINSHQLPSTQKKIDDVKNELFTELKKQQETFEARLQEIKDEQTRTAMLRASAPSAPKKAPIQF